MSEIVVLTTTDSQSLAQRLAAELVTEGLAACVNILPGIRSIYSWEGKLCDDVESLLLIKTRAGRFEDVRAKIRSLHTYQVPEIIAVPISDADENYLRWLRGLVPESAG
jgi:periplasmic divalent cation tolerance protein